MKTFLDYLLGLFQVIIIVITTILLVVLIDSVINGQNPCYVKAEHPAYCERG